MSSYQQSPTNNQSPNKQHGILPGVSKIRVLISGLMLLSVLFYWIGLDGSSALVLLFAKQNIGYESSYNSGPLFIAHLLFTLAGLYILYSSGIGVWLSEMLSNTEKFINLFHNRTKTEQKDFYSTYVLIFKGVMIFLNIVMIYLIILTLLKGLRTPILECNIFFLLCLVSIAFWNIKKVQLDVMSNQPGYHRILQNHKWIELNHGQIIFLKRGREDWRCISNIEEKYVNVSFSEIFVINGSDTNGLDLFGYYNFSQEIKWIRIQPSQVVYVKKDGQWMLNVSTEKYLNVSTHEICIIDTKRFSLDVKDVEIYNNVDGFIAGQLKLELASSEAKFPLVINDDLINLTDGQKVKTKIIYNALDFISIGKDVKNRKTELEKFKLNTKNLSSEQNIIQTEEIIEKIRFNNLQHLVERDITSYIDKVIGQTNLFKVSFTITRDTVKTRMEEEISTVETAIRERKKEEELYKEKRRIEDKQTTESNKKQLIDFVERCAHEATNPTDRQLYTWLRFEIQGLDTIDGIKIKEIQDKIFSIQSKNNNRSIFTAASTNIVPEIIEANITEIGNEFDRPAEGITNVLIRMDGASLHDKKNSVSQIAEDFFEKKNISIEDFFNEVEHKLDTEKTERTRNAYKQLILDTLIKLGSK